MSKNLKSQKTLNSEQLTISFDNQASCSSQDKEGTQAQIISLQAYREKSNTFDFSSTVLAKTKSF